MVPIIKTNIIWTSFLNNEIWTFDKRRSRFSKEPALPFNTLPLLNHHKIIQCRIKNFRQLHKNITSGNCNY